MTARFSVVGGLFNCAGQRKRRKTTSDYEEESTETRDMSSWTMTRNSIAIGNIDDLTISSPIKSRQSQYIRDYEGPRASKFYSIEQTLNFPPGVPPPPALLRQRDTRLRPLTMAPSRHSIIREEDEEDTGHSKSEEQQKKRRTTMSVILANFLGMELSESEKGKGKDGLESLSSPQGRGPPVPTKYVPPPSRSSRLVNTSVRPLSIVKHTTSARTSLEDQLRRSTSIDRLGESSSPRPSSYAGTVVLEDPVEATVQNITKINRRPVSSYVSLANTEKGLPSRPEPRNRLITPPPRAMVAGADDSEERKRRVLMALREKRELEVRLVNIEKSLKSKQILDEDVQMARSLSDSSKPATAPKNPVTPRRNSIGTTPYSTSTRPSPAPTQPFDFDTTSLPPTLTSSTTISGTEPITPKQLITAPTAVSSFQQLSQDALTDRSRLEPVLIALSKGYRVKDWVIKQSTNYRLRPKSQASKNISSSPVSPMPNFTINTTTTKAEEQEEEEEEAELVFEPSPLSSPSIIDISEMYTHPEFEFVFPITSTNALPTSQSKSPTTPLTPANQELRISMIRDDSIPLPPDFELAEQNAGMGGMPGDRLSIATTNFFSEHTWEPFLNAKDLDTAMTFFRARVEGGRRVAYAI